MARVTAAPPGRARRGSVAVMAAVLAVPLIAFAGFAIDAARMWLVQSRLQSALDAATLAAARQMTAPDGTANAIALFWADFGRTSDSLDTGYMGAVATTPVTTQLDQNTIQMTSTASVATPLIGIVGPSSVIVHAIAAAQRASTGMELSLVLDNTGSMAGWPIQAVIDSATELVDIVYGNGSADTQPNLYVAVAPFTAEVNLGASHTDWLGPGFDPTLWRNARWLGCVMARVATGDDFTDATPAQAPFTPFLYPSTLGKYAVGKTSVTGDDDWSRTNITEASQATLPANTAVGPDLGCSPLPVLPLTASRRTVLATIASMAAIYRGGTFINLGLQAGWLTLSPRWTGLWGNPALPLPYKTPNSQKVMVLMTDGNNEWYDWPGGAPGAGPAPWVNDGDTDYTAYGRLKMNLMGLPDTTQATATAVLNDRMSQMCGIIKSHGITLYTVIFNHDGSVAPATVALFQACASTPEDFFLTPTAADLQGAFQQIAGQLASLRLTR